MSQCESRLDGRQCRREEGHAVGTSVWSDAANTHQAGAVMWTDEAADAPQDFEGGDQ